MTTLSEKNPPAFQVIKDPYLRLTRIIGEIYSCSNQDL